MAAPSVVSLLSNSVRRPEDTPLTINVRRLDQPNVRPEVGAALRILLHVQYLGFISVRDKRSPLAPGLGVEALIIECNDETGMDLVEYRGLTADGFETPWLADGMLCGSSWVTV